MHEPSPRCEKRDIDASLLSCTPRMIQHISVAVAINIYIILYVEGTLQTETLHAKNSRNVNVFVWQKSIVSGEGADIDSVSTKNLRRVPKRYLEDKRLVYERVKEVRKTEGEA
mmetsp:Transcript_25567/g.46148  ORF Transcript_25567/g.46148 Transcript_25567/m.46148 type:complete len:113 (-) Transcript_25567:297-635(-)